jgi:hypothetical protein
MKFIVLIILMSNLSFAADSCENLKIFSKNLGKEIKEPTEGGELLEKRFEIIKTSMEYLKKIIDMKFETASFLRDNKELYGRYVSLVESKKDLKLQLNRLLDARNSSASDYVHRLNELDPQMPRYVMLNAHRDLTRYKNQETSNLDHGIRNVLCRLNKMEDEYYRMLARWAPYRDRLTQLQKLEGSLAESLEKLYEIEDHLKLFFKGTLGLINATTIASEGLENSAENCELILSELKTLNWKTLLEV